MPHPVEEIAEAASAVLPWCDFTAGAPAGRGWVGCEEACAGDAYAARWRAAVRQHLGGDVPKQVPAMFVLCWYLGVPAYAGALGFGRLRRVPAIAPRDLAFRLHPQQHYPAAVALRSAAFRCLAGDPAASHPDATVVTDETALAGELRAGLVAHARIFLDAYRPEVRIGPYQRWGALTDALDIAVWTAATADAAVRRDTRLVLGTTRQPPLTAPSTLHRIGGGPWTRVRSSCCLAYALPDTPACATCPRTPAEERARRVLAAAETG